MNQRQTSYVVTIQKLEDKYRQIEVEANGHFTSFVTDIKTKYKVKIDTFRTLMAVHKKELEKKQLEWEGGIKTLKNKNGHLNEQRKCLLLAYKKIKGEKDEQIRILQEENERLRRELLEAASKANVADNSNVVNLPKEVIVEKVIEVPVAAAAAVAAVATANNDNDEEVAELKRQIDDLKTALATAEAGTTEQEATVAAELEQGDPDVLESFYALQIEVEELREIEDNTSELRGEIESLNARLVESESAKNDLKERIDSTLEELKTADDADVKDHLNKLEKTNLALLEQNEQIKGQLAETSSKMTGALEREKKLKEKLKQNQQLKDEAKRNPKRAAAAVSAVVVRGTLNLKSGGYSPSCHDISVILIGHKNVLNKSIPFVTLQQFYFLGNRTGGGGNAEEMKKLKIEINRLNKMLMENTRQAKVSENKLKREQTMVVKQTSKAENEADQMRKRWENTKDKLTKKEDECKHLQAELSALQRSTKGASTEIKSLQVSPFLLEIN